MLIKKFRLCLPELDFWLSLTSCKVKTFKQRTVKTPYEIEMKSRQNLQVK